MPSIPLGLGDWESTTQDVQRLKLHNMYVVPSPASPDGVSRVSRPTLTLKGTVGVGPVTAIWQQNNVLAGKLIIASGTELYSSGTDLISTKIANLPGTDIPQFAGSQNILYVVRNGLLYYTTGTTLTLVTIPDSQIVQSIATINGYFLFSIKDTQKFYWIEPGATTVNALNFASAERIPDAIVAIQVIGDEVWFLGAAGPEVWAPTGEATAPFLRVSGRVYKEGCLNRDTVVSTSIGGIPALLWVTDTKAVVRSQGAPEKVSNESVEEILKTSDALSCWFFRYNRHDFYIINSPIFTLVYDITTDQWSRWDTYNKAFWVAQTGSQINSVVFCGDITSSTIYTLEEGSDDAGLPIVREVAGFLANYGKPLKCNEVVAYVNSGWSPSYTTIPTLELRWSDNLGATWSNYVQASLGERGDYSRAVSFRSLGLIRDPGRIFEFRISDFVRFRIDGVLMNERL